MYCWLRLVGTGKSTLVRFIISALGLSDDEVCYAAFTGKASLVLRDKGCSNAMTTHKLLYHSIRRKDGTFWHRPRIVLPGSYKIIVIDEISMLPENMWELLLSHNIHVLCLGDPFQLAPIGKDNGVLSHPHIFLDEIMRQAQESEIIRLTMDIRQGKALSLFHGEEVQVLDKKDIVSGMFLWADQVLVGKNDTRRNINALIREYLYKSKDSTPKEGDKIICLKNEWDEVSLSGDVIVNGSLGTIHNIQDSFFKLKDGTRIKSLCFDFCPEGFSLIDDSNNVFYGLNGDSQIFDRGIPIMNKDNYYLFPKEKSLKQFDYGYCITVHKAQGGEFDKVLVLEEFLRGDQHARWLYTAATRAKKKLVIIKDYR